MTVSTLGNAPWTTASAAPWLTVGPGGTGGGSVPYTVAPNLSPSARTGTLLVAGRTITITQAAAGPVNACSYAVTLTTYPVSAAGGSRPVYVTSGGTCLWTAVSRASWLGTLSGTPGVGNGTLMVSIAPNTTGVARTAR